MKRLFVHIVVFSLATTAVWAEGREIKAEPARVEKTKTTENPIRNAEPKVLLKAYSMNSLLFVETNSEDHVSVFNEKGKLERKVSPTGVLIAFPLSRGTYTVQTGDLSEQVVVR